MTSKSIWVAGQLKEIDVALTGSLSFEEVATKYLEEITPRKKFNSQRSDYFRFKALNRFFRNFLIDNVSAKDIHQYIGGQQGQVGTCTINRDLAFLSCVFNYAINVLEMVKKNPVYGIPRNKEPRRIKFFSGREFELIFNSLPGWMKPIVLFARNTGLRVSNIVNLRWDQISLENRMLFIDAEETKNSENLGLPLNRIAYEILEGRIEISSKNKRVFSMNDGSNLNRNTISKRFKKACVQAGYPEYRFHDLRHDFCSRLVQKGVDLYRVKQLAGHKYIETTQGYAHLRQEDLVSAVEMLD